MHKEVCFIIHYTYMLQSEVLPKVFWVWQENRVCKRNGGKDFKKRIHFSLRKWTLWRLSLNIIITSLFLLLFLLSFHFKICLPAPWLSSPFVRCPLLLHRPTRAPALVQHRLPFQSWCRGARFPPGANRWIPATKLDRTTTGRRTIPGHWTATYR